MGFNKILNKLAGLLDTGEGDKKARRKKSVRKLLEKLQHKEKKLRAKLEKTTDESEREKLARRIKVAHAHAEKAREYLKRK